MRTIFFGTPELGIPALEVLRRRTNLLAVVCQPDKEQGRGRKPVPPPVKEWAIQHGVTVCQPEKLNDGTFEAWLRTHAPDLCVVAAYGRLLKQPILDVPRMGFLNIHPSLLPKYRGPSPIQTSILNGETKTGVTIMKVTLEMDAGPIMLQVEAPIYQEDTSLSLTNRLAQVGAALLDEAITLLETGRASFTPQDDSQATYCKLFEKSDGQIYWNKPAIAIHNLVRAAIPWPVAFSSYRGETMRIFKTEPLQSTAPAEPGTITEITKDAIIVATGEGTLAIRELQMPGKRRMTTAEFLRGRKIDVGSKFETT